MSYQSRSTSESEGEQEIKDKSPSLEKAFFAVQKTTPERRKLKPTFWADVLPYYMPSYVFLVSHTVYQLTGNLLLPIWLAYVINMPFGWNVWQNSSSKSSEETNLDKASEKVFQKDKRFMGPLYVFVLNDLLTWIWCLCVVSEHAFFEQTSYGYLFENRQGDSLAKWAVFTFVWGYMAGVNGLAGHELIHKRDPFNKMLGMFTYSKILYSHFLLEHSNGHHRNVATPEDSATAAKNENFYCFAVKSAWGGHANTFRREQARIKSEHEEFANESSGPSLLKYFLHNRMTWFLALQAGILGAIYLVFGVRAVAFQLGYSSIGIFFIELINYTEHYGLERKKDSRGIYEPITDQHSWNSVSSPLLFRIQRHSDHHVHAYKPYQILRRIDKAPTMPFDYLYSMLLALVPPLWYRTMNPLVDKIHKRKPPQDQAKSTKMTSQLLKTFFVCFNLFLTAAMVNNF